MYRPPMVLVFRSMDKVIHGYPNAIPSRADRSELMAYKQHHSVLGSASPNGTVQRVTSVSTINEGIDVRSQDIL